jgi:hypothetical protein
MASRADELVADYLKRLNSELRGLPRARRRELVEEISGHIAEARADLESENEAAVRSLLDRLGEPAEIAAEARGRFGADPRGPRARDIVALVLLPIGGVILPVVGWFVGVVLLWVSDAWNTRDKLIGTLIFPGGLLVPIGLLFVGTSTSSCVEISSGPGPSTARTCSAEGGANWGLVVLFILLVLAPLATTAYLARRMRPVAPA